MYKDIIIRYISILILTFLFLSNTFQYYLSKVLTFTTYQILNLFYNVSLENNTIYYNNDQFLIIKACLGISAYILLTFFFLSLKENSTKALIYSLITFTILNQIRIIILTIIHIEFGVQTFNNIHLIFYEGLTGILTGITYVFFYKQQKLRSKPIFDDLKEIFKKIHL